ncbi:MAG: hypothetical protein CL927_08140 [Deltaproteobacteria bacterium]|nr:hypothetical protein [Deltaproteobacteria bacterium]HCH66965.1 hypothetical protein [Deltaproteobacteria bacterium]
MYVAFRSVLARLFTVQDPSASVVEELAEVTHLLEVVTAPLPVVAGAPPADHADFMLQIEWCDDLSEEEDATEDLSERRARQLLLHAGIDLEETMPGRRGFGSGWRGDGTQVFLSA